MKRQRLQNNFQEPNAKRIKKNKLHLNQDVLRYILSDFLYFDDVLNCRLSNSYFDTNPYRLNFETSDKINLNQLQQMNDNCIETYYFDYFFFAELKKELIINKKISAKIFRVGDNLKKPLEHHFENFKENKIHQIEINGEYQFPLTEKLPKTLKALFCSYTSHQPFSYVPYQLIFYKLDLPKNLPEGLETIQFGGNGNQFDFVNLPISVKTILNCENKKLSENLPDSIERIQFNFSNNKPLPNHLPKSLKRIEFSWCYNQPISTDLPETLETIIFGECYNQPLPDNLPKSLKHISFGDDFNQSIEHTLPDSIEKIRLGTRFNQTIDFKHFKSLKIIEFCCSNKKVQFFKNLPDSLEELYINQRHARVLTEKLPKKLPPFLKSLHFYHEFNEPLEIKLPQTLKTIRFGKKFNHPLPEDLPDSIEEIILSNKYKRILPNKLPKSLKAY